MNAAFVLTGPAVSRVSSTTWSRLAAPGPVRGARPDETVRFAVEQGLEPGLIVVRTAVRWRAGRDEPVEQAGRSVA